VSNGIVEPPDRTQLGRQALIERAWVLLLGLLLMACGGRTALESDGSLPSLSAPGAGGGGAPNTVSWDWDQIDWDGTFDESVVYLWTGSVNDTWAVISESVGTFHRDHWDGARWTRTVAENDSSARFEDGQIWAAANGHAFAGATSNDLQRWFGQAWAEWKAVPGCHAVGGSAEDDLWCATDSELWRFDGSRWTSTPLPGIRGIFARTGSDVWIWGARGASHFDGVNWSLELTDAVRCVSTSARNDVWAVQDGNLFHSAGPGKPWTRQNPTGARISSVWSESLTNTWIVAAGAAMRWNGSSWLVMSLPLQDERLLISGSSEDIWIAGTLELVHGRPTRR